MHPADYHNILATYSNQFGRFIQNIFNLMKNASGWLSQYFSHLFPSIRWIYLKYFQPNGKCILLIITIFWLPIPINLANLFSAWWRIYLADYHNILVIYSCQFSGFIQNIFSLMRNASGWLSQYFSYLFPSIWWIYSKYFQPNGECISLIIMMFWLSILISLMSLFKIFLA